MMGLDRRLERLERQIGPGDEPPPDGSVIDVMWCHWCGQAEAGSVIIAGERVFVPADRAETHDESLCPGRPLWDVTLPRGERTRLAIGRARGLPTRFRDRVAAELRSRRRWRDKYRGGEGRSDEPRLRIRPNGRET